jgi:hypothetical protein
MANMKGSLKLYLGIVLLIFVFMFFLVVMGCLIPDNSDAVLCRPLAPLIDTLALLIGA